MNNYQAQYYNEALLHYGVKGMKWGVRKAAKGLGDRAKTMPRAMVNTYTHPILSKKTIDKMNKNAPRKTQIRRRVIGYTTKEVKAYNRAMKKAKIASKKKKKKWGVRKAAKGLGDRAKTMPRAMVNTYTHPILSKKTIDKMNKNAPRKTQIRRRVIGYTTKEVKAYNRAMKKAKIASKKKKKKRRK